MSKEEIAEELEAYAEFLRLDGQSGRAYAYDKAADAVKMASHIPPNPARLNGIGDSTREAVINLENGVPVEELEQLREEYPWYDEFRTVKHIGPSRAREIHETLHIDTLPKLKLAAESGDIARHISGVGSTTEEKILVSVNRQL